MTISLVRHAHAGSRSSWTEADLDRPLNAKGRDQANAIAALLRRRPVRRLLSSPALRCQQTVAPLVHHLGLELELHDALAEGAPPEAAFTLVDGLVTADTEAVLCTHGDIIPEVIARLADAGVPLDGPPTCAKGSIWELDVHDGRVVAARYIPPT